MLREIVTAFLAINAIFWGLFPHRIHCAVVKTLGVANCPPHTLHLALGLVSFVVAMVVAQKH
jgi:hypothetical protein